MELLIEEFLYFGPGFVPGVREVGCNTIIDLVDVFVLHDGGQGGLLVGDLDFDNLLSVLFGFLLLGLFLGLHFVCRGI